MNHLFFKISLLIFLGGSQFISAQIKLNKIIQLDSDSLVKTWEFDYNTNNKLTHMSIVDIEDSISINISYNGDQFLAIHSESINHSYYNFDLHFFYNDSGQIDSISQLNNTDSIYYLLSYDGFKLGEVQQFWLTPDSDFLGEKQTYSHQGENLSHYKSYQYFSTDPTDFAGYSFLYDYNNISKVSSAKFSYFTGLSYKIRHYFYSDMGYLEKTDLSSYNGGGELVGQTFEFYDTDEDIAFAEVINPLNVFEALTRLSFTTVDRHLESFHYRLSDRLIKEIRDENESLLYSFFYENYEETTTTVNDFSKKKKNTFSVYPNPVIDYLLLSNELRNISIFDIRGKLISTSLLSNSIDVSHLNNGIYFLNGIDKYGERINVRFIK